MSEKLLINELVAVLLDIIHNRKGRCVVPTIRSLAAVRIIANHTLILKPNDAIRKRESIESRRKIKEKEEKEEEK